MGQSFCKVRFLILISLRTGIHAPVPVGPETGCYATVRRKFLKSEDHTAPGPINIEKYRTEWNADQAVRGSLNSNLL